MELESSAFKQNWLRKALLSRVQIVDVELDGVSSNVASIVYPTCTVLDVLTIAYTSLSAEGRIPMWSAEKRVGNVVSCTFLSPSRLFACEGCHIRENRHNMRVKQP